MDDLYFAAYGLTCLAIGLIAERRGRIGGLWSTLSIFGTPWIVGPLMLLLPRSKPIVVEDDDGPTYDRGEYVDIPDTFIGEELRQH